MQQKIADVIVRCLEAENIEYAFGISGSHYLAFFQALKKSSIKFISVTHECAAGYMAAHYARFAQKPALILGTAGPGAMNLLTGVAELYKSNLPCFVLTPIAPTNMQGKNSFQEDSGYGNSYSISDIMKCVTKKTINCACPANIPLYVRDLFRNGLYGRKGPVHLVVPTDYFEQKIDFIPAKPYEYRVHDEKNINPQILSKIAQEIKNSKTPLLFVGHRAWYPDVSFSIKKFSNFFRIPVILSASAKGLFDEYSEYFGGILDLYGHRSAEVLLKQSDLVISLGEDFGEFSTNKYEAGLFDGKLVQIDVDGYDVGRNYSVRLSCAGHLGASLDHLVSLIEDKQQFHSYNNINQIISHANNSTETEKEMDSIPLKPQRVLHELSRLFPQDALIIGDIGANGYFSLRSLKIRASSYSVLMSNYTMGQGVAGSLGAKLAVKNRPVIVICGDGSLLMNGMEIATAHKYTIPIIWVVFMNKQYGAVEWAQKLLYNTLDFCTTINVPELNKFAKAFAVDHYKIDSIQSLEKDFKAAVQNYLSDEKSAIIEIVYDSDEMLPLKPQSVKFIQDICNTSDFSTTPHLMKAFKSMLREKV